MSETLKNCPFCGGGAETKNQASEFAETPWYVICKCCCRTAYYETEAEAIAAAKAAEARP